MVLKCPKTWVFWTPDRDSCDVLIGLIDNGIITVDEIFSKHRALVYGLLNSRSIRDGYPTIDNMIKVMELKEKVCLMIIDKIEYNTFTLLDRFFGDIRKKKIYLAHVPWHFFLTKRLDW